MAACDWPRSAAFLDRPAEEALTHAPGGAPQDGGRKVLTHAPKDALEFLGGTGLENGGVDAVGFTLGSTIGVEIERQRFARHVFGAVQGIGVPVKGFAGGGIVGGNTNIPTPVNGIKIDYDMLASAMASVMSCAVIMA